MIISENVGNGRWKQEERNSWDGGRDGQEMIEISKSQALKHYAQKSALILLHTQMGDGERCIRGSCVW